MTLCQHLVLYHVLLQVGCLAKLLVTVHTTEFRFVNSFLVGPQVSLVEEDHRALETLHCPVHLHVDALVVVQLLL